jgi:hypothetical protein
VNEGVDKAARICAALTGAKGKEGMVVDRTTCGQNGQCPLNKSSCRGFGDMGTAVLRTVVCRAVRAGRRYYCSEPKSSIQCKSEVSLRRSGTTLSRGLHNSDNDARGVGRKSLGRAITSHGGLSRSQR